MNPEIGRVPSAKLRHMKKEFNGKQVEFDIKDFNIRFHQEKSGDKYWLAQFEVSSSTIHEIRKKLKLEYQSNYNPHIVVLESKIN